MTARMLVKRPRAIMFDLVATVVKTSLVDGVLLPYIVDNIQLFLEENWSIKAVQDDIANLRWAAKQDPTAPQIPESTVDRAQLITAVANYVRYAQTNQKDGLAMTLLRLHMWFDAYKRNRLQTPTYSDAASQLHKWHERGIKLCVLSNGWSRASQLFLSNTVHGNLAQLIAHHFDTELGPLDSADTYRKVLQQVQLPPTDVLFLTKDAKEGQAASQAGLSVILVITHRRTIEKLNEDQAKMARVRSFSDLDFTD